jgi:hypothetical protein
MWQIRGRLSVAIAHEEGGVQKGQKGQRDETHEDAGPQLIAGVDDVVPAPP